MTKLKMPLFNSNDEPFIDTTPAQEKLEDSCGNDYDDDSDRSVSSMKHKRRSMAVVGTRRSVQRNKAKLKQQRKFLLPQPISAVPLCSNIKEFLKFRVQLERMDNLNPKLHTKSEARVVTLSEFDESVVDEIDSREVFDMIRDINDPEHPLTLEELNVLEEDKITVDNVNNYVKINFTPTIPHCSMATLIGLAIRVQLMRSLPSRFKIDIAITPGSHASEFAINKQLADKERVAAALENAHLIEVVNQCLTIKGY